MRIAYVSADPGVPVFGSKGCSNHVQEVVRALIRRGAEVELFAASTGASPPHGLETVAIRQLPKPGGALADRERSLREANGAIHRELSGAGSFDLVYERYSLWSFAAMEYARDRSVPAVLEVNAPLIEEQARYRGLIDREGAEQVANRAFTAASVITAVSRQVAEHVARRGGRPGQVHVVPNGVDPRRFAPSTGRGSRHGFTVGFVGTLKPWHGLDTLVDAFAILHRRHPSTRLLIVGDGPERSVVESRIAICGVEPATTLTGSVPPRDVPGLLTGMDVAVAPYPALPDFYFSPLKVYEYMAAALPVVASRIGQLEDVIQHERNGLLCRPADSVAFAGAFERLYQAPAMRRQLGQAARRRIVEHHTWDHVVDSVLSLAGLMPAPTQVA